MAGDLPNRDITAGAPDAIVDMKYGNSYNKLITKAYKGSTLIFEREIDEWLYSLKNIDCNKSPNMADYISIQPENIYYINESICPFSYQNHQRDWEFVINAEPMTSNTGEKALRFLCNSYDYIAQSGAPHVEVFDGYDELLGGLIGGPAVWLEIRYDITDGSGNDKLGIYVNDTDYISAYGPNDIVNGYISYPKSQYGSIIGKDIRIIKQTEEENNEKINKIYYYIGGILVNTLKYSDIITTNCMVRSVMRSSNTTGFKGKINTFNFKFTSDVMASEYDEYDIVSYNGPAESGYSGWTRDDYSEVIEYETGAYDDIVHTIIYGPTSYAKYKEVKKYNKYNELTKSYTAIENGNGEGNISASSAEANIYPLWPADSGSGKSLHGIWKDIYDAITDTNTYDGFGIEFRPINGESKLYTIAYTDIDGNTHIETLGIRDNMTTISDYYAPFIFNGGLGTKVSNTKGPIYLLYDKNHEDSTTSNQVYMLGETLYKIFHNGKTVKVIYFNNIRQSIAFDSNTMKDLFITTKYNVDANEVPQNASWIMYGGNIEDYTKFQVTTNANNGCYFRLFGIKYKTEED